MKQVYVCALVLIACLIATTLSQPGCPLASQVAQYRLTFSGEFTAATALNSYGPFPNGSSPLGSGNTSSPIASSAYPFDNVTLSCNQSFFGHLIGATHNGEDTNYLWENVAHVNPSFAAYVDGSFTGSRLRNYINNHTPKKFDQLINIRKTLPFNGTESVEFYVNYTSPFVDVVASIYPSPDWFVGVSKLPLFEQGHWLRYIAIDLYAWDAGTRNGQDFFSVPTMSVPQGRITSLRNKYPFLQYQNPLGVMIFERLDSENCPQNGITYNADALIDIVSLTVRNTPCHKPIPYSAGTPYGVPPSDCYAQSSSS